MRRCRQTLGQLTLALGLIVPSLAGAAGDASAGRDKARQCAVCHGLDGVAKRPDVANIAGESEMYLIKQLQDFRSGARQHEQMSIIAGALSDADIADLAAYYASIEFTVKVPSF